jgi:hypothetical protein
MSALYQGMEPLAVMSATAAGTTGGANRMLGDSSGQARQHVCDAIVKGATMMLLPAVKFAATRPRLKFPYAPDESQTGVKYSCLSSLPARPTRGADGYRHRHAVSRWAAVVAAASSSVSPPPDAPALPFPTVFRP